MAVIGTLLLIVLFIGSSTVGESITRSKYPEYEESARQYPDTSREENTRNNSTVIKKGALQTKVPPAN